MFGNYGERRYDVDRGVRYLFFNVTQILCDVYGRFRLRIGSRRRSVSCFVGPCARGFLFPPPENIRVGFCPFLFFYITT